MYEFGTKAETLEFLSAHQAELGAKVLPLCYFTADAWEKGAGAVWEDVLRELPGNGDFIVRSSAKNEDRAEGSQAGKFESHASSRSFASFREAVDRVLASYDDAAGDNQVLVQPLLDRPEAAGVAFTVDPNGSGSYYVINYDATGSTSSITGGTQGGRLFYCFKASAFPGKGEEDGVPGRLVPVLRRLEDLLGAPSLDVEFAVHGGDIYIFQVRTLCMTKEIADQKRQADCIRRIREKVREENSPKPFLHGERTLYSNMTDWNPAEMIGTHPKNLALSLYRELITDSIWAYQRDNYGYMKLRSFPLMVDFCGMPYIDVRVSFNSFLPADLPSSLAEKLVDYYLGELERRPKDHDKAEFEILFSCYTFDLPERIRVLREHGFSSEEIEVLVASLRKLTNRIINSRTGLWRQDAGKIGILARRYGELMDSGLDDVGKMYWLVEDCKRYGTLPFAGLARAGFIAVQILQSMMEKGIIEREEYDAFLGDLETVGSRMKRDFRRLSREAFLRRYGHLRPGTYDITSPRYDERPDLYFHWKEGRGEDVEPAGQAFRLSLPQLERIQSALEKHGLDDDVLGFFAFIKEAIEGREYAKFMFTRNLSETLRIFGRWGQKNGISLEDCAFADVQVIREAYGGTLDEGKLLAASVAAGKRRREESMSLVLPPLIARPQDVERFFVPDSRPTFVTQRKAQGPVRMVTGQGEEGVSLAGRILLIPSADPGYDWIFSHGIAGFITEYGGANSHMAIRAGELKLPAVVGTGEKLFARLREAQTVEIDAALGKVTVLR